MQAVLAKGISICRLTASRSRGREVVMGGQRRVNERARGGCRSARCRSVGGWWVARMKGKSLLIYGKGKEHVRRFVFL